MCEQSGEVVEILQWNPIEKLKNILLRFHLAYVIYQRTGIEDEFFSLIGVLSYCDIPHLFVAGIADELKIE